MNRDDDFIGRLEDYLETFDGATPLPGQVRDTVRAGLPSTRQVRPVRGPGRMLDMVSRASTPARLGLVAAVVVAAVALGAAVVNTGRTDPGIGSTPATAPPSSAPAQPSPSAPAPTPAPPTSLSAAPHEPCAPGSTGDCVVAGSYRLSSTTWPGQITLDVPSGWFQWFPATDAEALLVDSGPDAAEGSGWGLMFVEAGAVSRDPCDASRGTYDEAETETVDGLVSAMRSWPSFDSTTPVAVEIDGYKGKRLELTSSRTPTRCPDAVLWTTPAGHALDAYPMVNDSGASYMVQFTIIDVAGTPIVIRATDFPDTTPHEASQGVAPDPTRHAADQVELHAMLDSIRIEAGTAQP